MNDRLQSTLRQLRLSGLAQSLDVRLQEAASHQLSHLEFLELILQDELLVRQQRQIDRRVNAAQFKEMNRWTNLISFSIPRSNERRSSTWPPVASFAKRRTCSWSAHLVPENHSWFRPSAAKRSSKDSSCTTARSSMWSATFSTMSRSVATRKRWPGTSNRIWSSLMTWA